MVRASGSYPLRRGFESLHRQTYLGGRPLLKDSASSSGFRQNRDPAIRRTTDQPGKIAFPKRNRLIQGGDRRSDCLFRQKKVPSGYQLSVSKPSVRSEHSTLSGFRSPPTLQLPPLLAANRFTGSRSAPVSSAPLSAAPFLSRTYSKATSGSASAPLELTSLGNGSPAFATARPKPTGHLPALETATRLKAWSELHSFGRPRYIAKNRSLFGPPTSAPVTRRIDRWAENPFPKCWSDDRNPLGHWRLWRVFRKQGKIFLSEVWRHRSCAKPSRTPCPLDHWTFSLFDTFYAQFFPQEAGPVSCWMVARVSTSTGQKDGMIEFLARFST